MCWQCVVEYGGDQPGLLDDATRAVADLVRRFYELPGCSVGGPLHIVIDDSNVDDEHIDWCVETLDSWMDEWWRADDAERWWAGPNVAKVMVHSAALELAAAIKALSLPRRALAVNEHTWPNADSL